MKNVFLFFLELLKTVILALAIVIPIRYFIFQPFIVKGNSMEPNFKTGNYLIIDEITYRFRNPKRGEIVVFKYPGNEAQKYIKRVIGLPGETVEIFDGKIKITNEKGSFYLDESSYLRQSQTFGELKITLGEDEYFVLGDNRLSSYDSRMFGPVKRKEIIGRVILRLFPLNEIKLFLARNN
ncbi:signal peptidase I [Candidatus Parcubacteria bacterium]|nr:signal peptidase I [Candidatus Parcubacteria bacterium]